ncbi:hypothetical protein OAU81_00060 [bacterium]|nr:hypothetical protein [bacterium]
MALEEQLSNDLGRVADGIAALNKQLEISNQDKFKAPVPPSLDKVKIESQGPNMSDSKTVGAWKDLITKVVGPALQKSNRTDPQKTLKSADQSRGIISDQLSTLNKQYDLDTSNQQILLDIVDQYKLQADQMTDLQSTNVLNTDTIVGQLIKTAEHDDQSKSIDGLSQSITAVMQQLLQQDDLSTGEQLASLSDSINSTLNTVLNQDDQQANEHLASLSDSINSTLNTVLNQDDQQANEHLSNISDNIDKALLATTSDESSSDGEAVDRLQQIANLSEQQLLTSQEQLTTAPYNKEMADHLQVLVDINERQLLTTTDAEEARKVESQVVTQADRFQLTSMDREAQKQFSDMFQGIEGDSKSSMMQGDAGQMEEAGGSIISDIMSGAFTDLLADGVGNMLGKTGGWMKSILGKAFSLTGKIFKPFVGAAKWVGRTAARGIKGGLSKSFSFGKKVLGKFFGSAKDIGLRAATSMKSGLGRAFSFAGKTLKGFGGAVGRIGLNAATKLRGGLSRAFSFSGGILKSFMGSAGSIATKAAGMIRGGLGKAFSKIPKLGGGIGKGLAAIGANAGTGVLGAVKSAIPTGGGMLKTVGKLAKFAGPIGAIVTGGMAVFDGIGGAMEEYKKSGSITAAAREGVAAAASGLTFGLVDQETFSGIFSTIGDAMGPVGDFFGNQMEAGWSTITNIMDGNFTDALGSAGEMLTFGLLDSETISNFTEGVGDTLSKAGSFLSEGASSVWDSVTGFFSNSPDVWDVLDESGNNLSKGTQKVADSAAKVTDAAMLQGESAEKQSESMGSMIGDLFTRFTPLGGIANMVTGTVSNLKTAAGDLADGASPLDTAGDLIKNQATSLLGGLADVFTSPLNVLGGAGSMIADAAGGLFDSVTGWFSDVEEPDPVSVSPKQQETKQMDQLIQSGSEQSVKAMESNKELTARLDRLIEIQTNQLDATHAGIRHTAESQKGIADSMKKSGNTTVIQNSSSSNTSVQNGNNSMETFRRLITA